jgi:hypothetical protein
MEFNIIRSPDKEEIKAQVLDRVRENDFDSSIGYDDMRIGEFVNSLRKLVKMREVADEAGVGFAAFFRGPSGKWYYISNVNHWRG